MTTVRMKRRAFLVGLGVSASAALLSACTGTVPAPGQKPAESKPAAAQPAAPAAKPAAQQAPAKTSGSGKVVTFWGRTQFLPESNAWIEESVKMAAKEGGFEVKVDMFSNDDHVQKEVVAMEAKQVPDVTMTTSAALFYQNGFAIELADVYDEVGKSGGGWFPAPENFSLMNGKRIGVPLNIEPWWIHLRKDVFEAAGVTVPFKSYAEMVDGLKKVTKGAMYGFGGQMTNADYAGNALPLMMAHGGRIFDKDSKPTIFTPKNLAGFKAYTDLFTEHKVMPPGVVQWDAAGNNKAWLSGQVAAVSNTGSIVLAMRKDQPDMLKNSVFQAWPGADGNPPATVADGFMLVVNKGPNEEQSKQIIKKILSKERYPGNLEAAGSYWFPALKNYSSIDFFTKDPYNKMISDDVLPYALAPFADGGRNPIYDDIGVASWGDALQLVATGGKSAEEGLKLLDQRAKEAAEKFKQ
ncbi:MAG: ABC transporter substrate-binding protein [Chloroflexota bacterium]